MHSRQMIDVRRSYVKYGQDKGDAVLNSAKTFPVHSCTWKQRVDVKGNQVKETFCNFRYCQRALCPGMKGVTSLTSIKDAGEKLNWSMMGGRFFVAWNYVLGIHYWQMRNLRVWELNF